MSNENFAYPLDSTWDTAEIIKVTNFYSLVADAYEIGVDRQLLLAAYQDFKQIVPMKFEEKQLDRELTNTSGYSIYQAMKVASEATTNKIKVTK